MTISEHDEAITSEGRRRRRIFRSWGFYVTAIVAIGGAAVGVHFWSQYRTITSGKYSVIDYTVPRAPHLVTNAHETVYRIDPTHSALSYQVQEKLFGHSAHRANGTTNGIAGDVAIDAGRPAASRIGQIIANVEQLHSDNNLRDARMRAANLESHDFPLAYLTVSGLSGMPASIQDGHSYHFTMHSQLTVKRTPAPATWTVDAKLTGGKLIATATTKVKMSTFGIGPITIAGLVSTSNDVTLTMKLTALDPSKFNVPTQIAAPKSVPRRKDSPSFKTAILPVLQANCASCHNAGEVGAAHWLLADAGDAAAISDGIGSVVSAKYMPPWPASNVGVPLRHSKQLDNTEVADIVKWSEAGGPLDVPATTKITPTAGPQGTPPRHDVTMPMPQAYAGSLSVPNDYRCFVLDPHLTKTSYVTGYEVTPAQRAEIHHVQIFHIDGSQAEAGKQRSGSDGKPGWSCYAGPDLPSRGRATAITPGAPKRARHRVPGFTGQPGLIAGWVPGQDPVIYPDRSGILFEPGDALVLQVHYHYDKTPVPDRTTVALQVDPGTAKIKPLDIINPIGPVEIPCMPGATEPLCDRGAALQDDMKLYGPSGATNEIGLLLLCGKHADELAATFHNGVASSSCDSSVPESGTMVGAMGHMHTLGKSFRLTLDPGTPQQKVLLDIPTWNFDWQMNYEFQKPIHVEAGHTIRMECSWDRALDPNRPQKYVVFAEGTEDEMCFSTYAIIPDKY